MNWKGNHWLSGTSTIIWVNSKKGPFETAQVPAFHKNTPCDSPHPSPDPTTGVEIRKPSFLKRLLFQLTVQVTASSLFLHQIFHSKARQILHQRKRWFLRVMDFFLALESNWVTKGWITYFKALNHIFCTTLQPLQGSEHAD